MSTKLPPSFSGVYEEPAAVTGSLNDLLRQKLNAIQLKEPPNANRADNLLSCALDTVEHILHAPFDKACLDQKLETLFECQQTVYHHANIPAELRKRQFIGRHGLVMSPDYCITTVKDSLRVRAFLRAIDHGIANLRKRVSGSLNIVYPACGPFAPLLIPLIGYYKQKELYSEQDVQITLIDSQPGAIASLHALIDALQIRSFIRDIQLLDGCEYQTTEPVHMVVLEAMQHGFSREGHLALARHFANMIEPDGCFIPNEIRLTAVISEGQQEYIEQWRGKSGKVFEANMSPESLKHRVVLGDILNLTPDSLRQLKEQKIDQFTSLIECGTVPLPDLPDTIKQPLLLICTRVITGEYEGSQEVIGEYDSGITHPLPDMQMCINFIPKESKPGDLLVNSGDRLKFYYRLNGLPGFMPVKI
ncbi:hypothetical protein GZ77_16460 [Endozoicomonas montiporae]|uniref:Uncharacterized protein n=2 Tax=Endozoicomonas montiporae TaxID=1027273 RepID=A0A081N5Y2_9GAMM|nr:hypothetical protein [Endozoicomonas montiporae]AMO57236.1 hypothetical protein EZMO1_3236 [Endozoicomonas montiporae CL-33]KEQ13855.1 hypothetical protein GZ77_16460 [Endozoicomonas montiporae]